MTIFSLDELKNLVQNPQYPCVSLYLPVERLGGETRQNPIRFKNLHMIDIRYTNRNQFIKYICLLNNNICVLYKKTFHYTHLFLLLLLVKIK